MKNYNRLELIDIPLLITGCIAPTVDQKWLVIADENIRLNQYVDSIAFYIKSSFFKKIVFCDNSGYKYEDAVKLIRLANEMGKAFEWISFKGDYSLVRKYGKGAGEDEIVDFALNNSTLLKNAKSFAKTTGRLKIRNINKVCRNIVDGENYFYRDIYRTHCHGVDTRFYVCDKKYFSDILRNCYNGKTLNPDEYALEDIYYKLLNGNYHDFSGYFDILGVSGGNGRIYTNEFSIWKHVFDIFCRLNLYNKLFPCLHFLLRISNKIRLG